MMPKLNIQRHILPRIDSHKVIQPTCIVLHWWGEPINDQGIQYLDDLLKGRLLSVQYAVLSNGDIYQLSPFPETYCKHAKCANESSIGIEIEGHNQKDLDANKVQLKSVVKLVQNLCKEYGIEKEFRVIKRKDSMRFFGVASHKQVDVYCPNSSNKVNVHDEYIEKVKGLLI